MTAPVVAELDLDQVRADLSSYIGAPGLLCLWSLPSKISYTFDTAAGDIRQAAQIVAQLDASGEHSIYHQGVTLREQVASDKRGTNDNVSHWLRLQFDIDFGKPGYAPDARTASRCVLDANLPEPTAWVHSGHGIYPRWEFATPEVDTPLLRKLAEDMADELRRAFAEQGYSLDKGLGKDPARVWRIPGTVNRKDASAPLLCYHKQGNGARLDYAGLRAVVPTLAPPPPVKVNGVRPSGSAGDMFWDGRTYTPQQAKDWIERFAREPLRRVQDGSINTQLNESALVIGHFVQEFYANVEQAVAELEADLSHTAYDGKTWKARPTILSGLNAGMRDPYQLRQPRPTPPAVEQVASTAIAQVAVAAQAAPDVEEAPAPFTTGQLNLPTEFWNARPVLKQIRDAALSCWACPDAVFGSVLAYSSAYAHPGDSIDTGIGESPLTLFTIPYGAPSAGKGLAVQVARRLMPPPEDLTLLDEHGYPPFRERPVGSGEGITEGYFRTIEKVIDPEVFPPKKRQERAQVHRHLMVLADEGEALAKLASRQGSTLATTIRRAWSGELLGEGNAGKETNRELERGSYSIAMIVAFQPETIGPLFDSGEIGGGTPHRFLYVAADDDTLPAEPPTDLPRWPGELALDSVPGDNPVDWRIGGRQRSPRKFQLVDPAAVAEIKQTRWDGLRRATVGRELDGHMNQMRARVAAHLAQFAGRITVDADDWRLAGMVVEASNRVRDAAVAFGQGQMAAKAQAFDERVVKRDAQAHAVKLSIDEQREVDRVTRGASVLARKVLKDAPVDGLTRSQLRSAGGSRYRPVLDDCLAVAVDREWLITEEFVNPHSGQAGTRWKAGPRITEAGQ